MTRLRIRTKNTGIEVKTNTPVFLMKRPIRLFGSGLASGSRIGSFFFPCSDASIGTRVSATKRDASSAKVTVRA